MKKQYITCTPNCVYFPQEVEKENIKEIKIIDGVMHRTVVRNCLYDGLPIKSWRCKCHRGSPKEGYCFSACNLHSKTQKSADGEVADKRK